MSITRECKLVFVFAYCWINRCQEGCILIAWWYVIFVDLCDETLSTKCWEFCLDFTAAIDAWKAQISTMMDDHIGCFEGFIEFCYREGLVVTKMRNVVWHIFFRVYPKSQKERTFTSLFLWWLFEDFLHLYFKVQRFSGEWMSCWVWNSHIFSLYLFDFHCSAVPVMMWFLSDFQSISEKKRWWID